MLHIGIGDGDQTVSWEGGLDLFLIPLEGSYFFQLKRLQTGTDQENGGISVLYLCIVNEEGGRSKIGIRADYSRALLTTDVVGSPLIRFYWQTLPISEGMNCSNSVHIITLPIAPCTKVTITDPSASLKLMRICWGDIHL
ncbi:hypothetical protein [Rhodocytophaga rosea]|uniref:hypothetical protein n=1 Tax=Rhodocytophaga rosea TaxID=2704465 RepID=UPI00293BDD85|nr:hypothetical protein [Rhodocytophaga rosea]